MVYFTEAVTASVTPKSLLEVAEFHIGPRFQALLSGYFPWLKLEANSADNVLLKTEFVKPDDDIGRAKCGSSAALTLIGLLAAEIKSPQAVHRDDNLLDISLKNNYSNHLRRTFGVTNTH